MTAGDSLLELRDVTVVYAAKKRRRVPLDQVSFTVGRGEILVVLGNSGTGKSTLLDVIAGFIRPTPTISNRNSRAGAWLAAVESAVQMTGQVYMDGEDVTSLEPRDRQIGLVMQRFNLYPHMSVRKNLEFPLKMRGRSKQERDTLVEEKATLLEINEHLNKAPSQLSVGEQQRVAIAKMLLCGPRIALFDEAFSNLNWELRDFLYQKVVKAFVADREKGVVFVSHNLLDAVEANRILYLKRKPTNDETEIRQFPQDGGNAWNEFEAFLSNDSKLYSDHRERYARIFTQSVRAMRVSGFGHKLYAPLEVLHDDKLSDVLKTTFRGICAELDIPQRDVKSLINEIWTHKRGDLLEFEEDLQRCVEAVIPTGRLQSALEKRSKIIADQVRPFLVGNTIADIGCGDGLVSWYLKDSAQKIVLTDVHSYLDSRITFPYYGYSEGQSLPLGEPMDTTLLLTVLHHSEDPRKLLSETRRVTKKRTIIIESVFGVAANNGPESILRRLDVERQFKYQTFLDWLYNRVFHDGVPVPFNFNTPAAWEQLFKDTGWIIETACDLGIDQPIVPEHHFLFVLKPSESAQLGQSSVSDQAV
jgi:ABC-type nitrate/sulfonate/bicarbonate transport system ATPase subunit